MTEAECVGPCCGMRRFQRTNGERVRGPWGLRRGFTAGQPQILPSEEAWWYAKERAEEVALQKTK